MPFALTGKFMKSKLFQEIETQNGLNPKYVFINYMLMCGYFVRIAERNNVCSPSTLKMSNAIMLVLCFCVANYLEAEWHKTASFLQVEVLPEAAFKLLP